MSSTPSRNVAVLNSGRGSRPGFSSSSRMSLHGRQRRTSRRRSCVGSSVFSSAGVADQRLHDRARRRPAMRFDQPVALRGARPMASSGLSPPRMRRKPAACSNVLSPRRGTFSSAARDRERAVLVAVGDDALRRALRDQAGHARQQRRRRGVQVDADRVHAVLDHRVERARQLRSGSTSCWYWPTPIDFGSIFTSSASGSCRRRAIETAPRSDHVQVGEFLAGDFARRNRPRRRLR